MKRTLRLWRLVVGAALLLHTLPLPAAEVRDGDHLIVYPEIVAG